jgi:hypothetical protein
VRASIYTQIIIIIITIIIDILLDSALSASQAAPFRAETPLLLHSDSTVAPESRGHVHSPDRDPDTAILHVVGLLTAFRKRLGEFLVAITLQTR